MGIPLALAGIFLGQLFGFALMLSWSSEAAPDPVTVTELLTSGPSDLLQVWKDESSFTNIVFLGIAVLAGFTTAKKAEG